jgi:hypothetical protein
MPKTNNNNNHHQLPAPQAATPQTFDSTILQTINPNAAGIDVASAEMWVCVPADRAAPNVRTFGACTDDLEAIAEWLRQCRITSVAMESTGVYWIPLYQVLEARGLEVCLTNARHLKNVSGRPKTDRLDCQWVQRLHAYGFLRASFRPTDAICQIRSIQRHRGALIRDAARHIQPMPKALHQMDSTAMGSMPVNNSAQIFYPFTAPPARPYTNCFSMIINKRITGIIASKAAAIR